MANTIVGENGTTLRIDPELYQDDYGTWQLMLSFSLNGGSSWSNDPEDMGLDETAAFSRAAARIDDLVGAFKQSLRGELV